MRVISKKTLIAFWQKHPAAEQPLKAWYDEACKATWETPQQIKNQYRNASIVGHNRVVFNIKGNDFRLVVAVAYAMGALFIKFVGTHADYDRIDVTTVGK